MTTSGIETVPLSHRPSFAIGRVACDGRANVEELFLGQPADVVTLSFLCGQLATHDQAGILDKFINPEMPEPYRVAASGY